MINAFYIYTRGAVTFNKYNNMTCKLQLFSK